MMTPEHTPPRTARSDIVESELHDILQTVIDARCGLSAIHQILDDARTMSEIRARFVQWQTDQRDRKQPPVSQ
jgi:hypothetical protein